MIKAFKALTNSSELTTNGAIAQYNGNISEILWRGPDAKTNSYGYSYDPMNRLTKAKYYNAADVTKNGRFNEKIGLYDLNGNIKSLFRNGRTGEAGGVSVFGQMDNLAYSYNGNQLIRVDESATASAGFINGTNGGDDYAYDGNGNMIHDLNKGIGSTLSDNANKIFYNHLNLPARVQKSANSYVQYVYDATGRKLQQVTVDNGGPVKTTDYAGRFIYENDVLQFINHEEGRVVMTGSQPEYQYHLKDHLGNVRVTFTTKEETDSNTATLEAGSLLNEQAKFLRRDRVRIVNNPWFDHTNDATAANGGAIRLSGNANEKTGLIRSMSVMPGDVINAEVYAKYIDPSATNLTTALSTLLSQIVSGTTPAGTVADGASYSTNGSNPFPYTGLNNTAGSTGVGPKAYLNYLVFDKDYNFKTGGYQRLSGTPKESGNNVAHEKLSAQINITEAGYVYVYLSNEESSPVEVFFDDLEVTQVKSPVVASNDYYPFGLQTSNSYARENSLKQDYLYNGKEIQDKLNLGWLDYGARMYDPIIGRFTTIDPLTTVFPYLTPYQYASNDPVANNDIDGLEGLFFTVNPWMDPVMLGASETPISEGLLRVGEISGKSLESLGKAAEGIEAAEAVGASNLSSG